MKKNNKNNITSNIEKDKGLRFWIPFISIVVLSLLFIFINQSTIGGWIICITAFAIMFFSKKMILNMKRSLRVTSWILTTIILFVSCFYTRPKIIDIPVFSSRESMPTEIVKTESGLVSGVYNSDKSVKVFAGLPYAAPPVGELRWKEPQQPKSWTGVRTADHFSDCAMQSKAPGFLKKLQFLCLGSNAFNSSLIKDNEAVSEDCLYLNVWTPAKSTKEKCPVIVYIHGGSYTSGSGSTDIYNGEGMAKKGVVFVTINYRLGIFGFMSHPELTKESGYNASGNYGVLDQIAALKWVKNNISAFGGDANNVTIAGESAGSMSVNILVASPLAKGLFQHAIGESGGVFGSRGIVGGPMITLAQSEKEGLKFAKSQKNSSIKELRKMSAKDLLKASKNENTRPIVDGYLLPNTIYNIFAEGKQNDVPVIIGSNADEGSLFLTLPMKYSATNAEKFKTNVKQTYGDRAEQFLKLYPAENNSQAVISQLDSGRDQWFGWHMHTWAKLQSETGKSKVYLYYFNHVQPSSSRIQQLGAYHSSEIAYAYNNLGKVNLPYKDADRKLSDIMSSYWVNFATTGNPNDNVLPEWKAYNEKSDEVIELGDSIKSIPVPHKENLKFLDDYEASLRKK